jgi:hypothetical protein
MVISTSLFVRKSGFHYLTVFNELQPPLPDEQVILWGTASHSDLCSVPGSVAVLSPIGETFALADGWWFSPSS